MSALVLIYGSRARGDFNEFSDIDLLISSSKPGLTSPVLSDGISIHFYDQKWITREASKGSLFAYHLTQEAILLAGSIGHWETIKNGFRFKNNYAEEKKLAINILSLLKMSDNFEIPVIRKRAIWAVRTLSAALAAEGRRLGFSASSCQNEIGLDNITYFINNRASVSGSFYYDIVCNLLRKFDVLTEKKSVVRSNLGHQGYMGLSTLWLVDNIESNSQNVVYE